MVTQFTVIADTSRPLTSDPANLATLLMVCWGLMYAILNVSIQQLVVKGFEHVKPWVVLCFSGIIAAYCWGGSLACLLPANEPVYVPPLGFILAFMIAALPMMVVKHRSWLDKIYFCVVFPLIMAFGAFASTRSSIGLASLPLNELFRELGVLLWFFFGCFLCSAVFSAWKVAKWLDQKVLAGPRRGRKGDDSPVGNSRDN